jgi:hypothetical protein
MKERVYVDSGGLGTTTMTPISEPMKVNRVLYDINLASPKIKLKNTIC